MTKQVLSVAENAPSIGGVSITPVHDEVAGARWSPWRLLSIEVRDALVAIRVGLAPSAVPSTSDESRTALAAMVRVIGHVLAEGGLLRPLVVYLHEPPKRSDALGEPSTSDGVAREAAPTPDDARDRVMQAWEDDQDWHRGRFMLFTDLPQGLLTPRIEGFARTSEVRRDDDTTRLAAVSNDPRWTDHALWAAVSDWATAVKKRHGRRAPDDAAKRDLDTSIAAWVAAQPLPATSSDLPTLVLASYSPEEPPPVAAGVATTPEAFLYLDATAAEDARRGWEATVNTRLLDLRRSLQRRRLSTLAVHARCTPALAIRAGAVFHASSGLTLAVVQRNPGTQQDELWRLTEGRAAQPVPLEVERLAPAGAPTELQLRISVTQPVDADADAWTAAATPAVNPFVLRITVPHTGDQAIRGPDDAWDIARAVRAALRDTHAALPRRLPVRIFFSGPTALAVWLGAQLNAAGTVALMDWTKSDGRPRYVESFTFQPGA